MSASEVLILSQSVCERSMWGALLQEGKLEPSEELGDLFKGAGDNTTALACYQTAGSTTKVVEGEASHPTACY